MTTLSFAREILETVSDGSRTHAAYPSAFKTLCGLPRLLVTAAESALPDCEDCVTAAYNFRRIDGTAPPSWFEVPIRCSTPTMKGGL